MVHQTPPTQLSLSSGYVSHSLSYFALLWISFALYPVKSPKRSCGRRQSESMVTSQYGASHACWAYVCFGTSFAQAEDGSMWPLGTVRNVGLLHLSGCERGTAGVCCSVQSRVHNSRGCMPWAHLIVCRTASVIFVVDLCSFGEDMFKYRTIWKQVRNSGVVFRHVAQW